MTSPEQTMTSVGSSIAHADCAKEALISTLSAICGSEPTYKGDGMGSQSGERIVGIISIMGDVAWSVMMGFPSATAMDLVTKFCGFEIPFDSEDMGDVVGELANVMAGDLVARLDGAGLRAEMSLPTVARGCDVDVMPPAGATLARMNFGSACGDLWMDIASVNHSRSSGR
jgi:chemotaxis protein CheX